MMTFNDLPSEWELEPKGSGNRKVDVLHLKDTDFRVSIDWYSDTWVVDYTTYHEDGTFNTWEIVADGFEHEEEAIAWAVAAVNLGLWKDWK